MRLLLPDRGDKTSIPVDLLVDREQSGFDAGEKYRRMRAVTPVAKTIALNLQSPAQNTALRGSCLVSHHPAFRRSCSSSRSNASWSRALMQP